MDASVNKKCSAFIFIPMKNVLQICETDLSEWMRGARVLLVVHQKSKWREKALSRISINMMMTTMMIIKPYSLPSLGFLISDNNMLRWWWWCMLISISTGNSCTTAFFYFYIYPIHPVHLIVNWVNLKCTTKEMQR